MSNERITLRWRVHKGKLLFYRRHLRALKPLGLPAPLMGWIGERLEWAVDNMFNEDSEGVLVLRINPENDVTLSLDEVCEAPRLTMGDLLVENEVIVGVQHDGELVAGTVWLEKEGVLCASCDELVSATGTLVRDLAATLGLPIEVSPQRQADAANAGGAPVFLISDEFGFVPILRDTAAEAADPTGVDARSPTAAERIRDCFAKLW
jgi:hypothetical protein